LTAKDGERDGLIALLDDDPDPSSSLRSRAKPKAVV
jgi:hypothetical protein